SLMAGHLERPPVSFEISDPEGRIPPDLRKILLDALEKRPEDRIPSAADFVAAIAEVQQRFPVDKTEVEALFAVPGTAPGDSDPEDLHLTKNTRTPETTQNSETTGETTEAGLYLRSSAEESTRSGALPLVLAAHGVESGENGATVDDITWGTARPLPAAAPENSPLLFRLALATATLLLLLVVARTLWRPVAEARAKAPNFAAAIQAPSPAPVVTKPVLPEPVPESSPRELPARELPRIAETETLKTPETPRVIEETVETPVPAPALVQKPRTRPAPVPASREHRRKPAPVRIAAVKRKAPPSARHPAPPVALARRAPRPWEEGTQPPDLLKPGPGVEEPVPLSLPRFAYPSAAHGTGVRADVRLALLVDERGRVIDARVREGAPPNLGFAETALAAAKRISFQPATRHEVPGKMWTEMILEFAE
ncbi:MAG TPA: TonB family protein, partial [Thermoanaerobaculia bacterium]